MTIINTEEDAVSIAKDALSKAEYARGCGLYKYDDAQFKSLLAVMDFVRKNGLPEGITALFDSACFEEYSIGHFLQTDVIPILSILRGPYPEVNIVPGEAWSDAALEYICENKQLNTDSSRRENWFKLIEHCCSAHSPKPTKKWLKTAEELLKSISLDDFLTAIRLWFPMIAKNRPVPLITDPRPWVDPNVTLCPNNERILKGLVWCCIALQEYGSVQSIGELVLASHQKVRGTGPRAMKLGTAAIHVLSQLPCTQSLTVLTLIKIKNKYKPGVKSSIKAIETVANKLGIDSADAEELAIERYGFTEVGVRTELFGQYEAKLSVSSRKNSVLQWLAPDGKTQKTVPAAVKTDHADALSKFKTESKQAMLLLSALTDRLEQFMYEEKSWSYKDWMERYIDHPIHGIVARPLLWNFTNDKKSVSGMWFDGQVIDKEGKSIIDLKDSTRVSLWHPVEHEVDEIVSWRDFIVLQQIVQPFKQAHREVYLITPAELETVTFSKRYASHVLRTNQFAALCKARNWVEYPIKSWGPQPKRLFPKLKKRAEFFVREADTVEEVSNVFRFAHEFLVSDSLQFWDIDAPPNVALMADSEQEPFKTKLNSIPKRVFSEIFRDVDMYVSVCGLGSEPGNWAEIEEAEAQARAAVARAASSALREQREESMRVWINASFGELNTSGKARLDLLKSLVPKLKISGVCSFDDRCLIVEGKLRTYKIHLTSGNVLMSPNDQYLCIVRQRNHPGAGKVYLPFEGDDHLSVILSKAFMLAEDNKIKDQDIVRQINS